MNNSRNGFGDIQARARILVKIDRLMLGIKGNENQLARETGLRRESLYKALSAEGNPEFATILKVVNALGLRLRAESARGMMHS